jgi:hypothetical protein
MSVKRMRYFHEKIVIAQYMNFLLDKWLILHEMRQITVVDTANLSDI